MRTPIGPEVGEALRAGAEPCGCLYENGNWWPCEQHPASCQAVVLWQFGATAPEPLRRCGIPIPEGDHYCPEHTPRCETCGRQEEGLDAENRCAECARQSALNRAALSRN